MNPHIATLTLRAFQDEFAQALLATDSGAIPATDVAALIAEPGFAVYRNTVMKGCVDALQANYPAVERLVGEEWLRAAAAIYARAELPSHPMLLAYGAGFAEFLRTFAPAAELPYLADVARLDRFWSEAHTARDEEPLEPAVIRRRSLDELARVVLRLHAASHEAAPQIAWTGEGALITRPHGAVQAIQVDAAACAFLDACAAARSMTEAASAAIRTDPTVDLSALMASLLNAGAFASGQATEELR